MKIRLIVFCFFTGVFFGAAAKGKPAESFSDAETNFKWVMQKILDKYIDKNLSREELYRAATAGMVQSLNRGEETWNKLLSPEDLNEMQADLSGKVTGIGVVLKFDEPTGHGQVLKTTAGSPAEKAGIQPDDRILSVDGKSFKGGKFPELVQAVRGEVGKQIHLRVLRGDQIVKVNLRREAIPWTPVELESIDPSVSLLTIGFFNDATPKLVEEKLKEFSEKGARKLIVDARENEGGGFDQAVKVAGLFLPAGETITSTKNRDGKIETFRSERGLLGRGVSLVVLTDKGTFCGGELFVAALKENLKVKTVGQATFGKWNSQSVETLPNHFALKYTVQEFRSPKGRSFQGVGIAPDLEVALSPDTDLKLLRSKYEASKRASFDTQLKAAIELIKAG